MARWSSYSLLIVSALAVSACAQVDRNIPAASPDALAAARGFKGELAARHYEPGSVLIFDRAVVPGVAHHFASIDQGPYTLNALTIDIKRDDLILEAEKGRDDLRGSERLPDMMRRLADPAARPVAAVNGDFWGENHIPINAFVDEGTLWKHPWVNKEGKPRACFVMDENENTYIGIVDWSLRLKGFSDEAVLAIDGVNFKGQPSATRLYTWPSGETSPELTATESQIVLRLPSEELLPNAPVKAKIVSVDETEPVALDNKTVVVVVEGSVPEWLHAGESVTIDARITNVPGKVTAMVGGGPVLVRDGEVVVGDGEAFGEAFITDRHPRTAIGITADGKLVMAVVDGRQPGLSIGMGLQEFGEFMKARGCVSAMNLDGGGSSTMTVRDEVVNFPSDAGGPRSVSNALVVRRTAPVGPLAQIVVEQDGLLVPPGATVALAAKGFDVDGEPVSLDGWTLNYRGKGVDGDTLTIGDKPAVVTLEATPTNGAGAAVATRASVWSAPVATITVSPARLLLGVGDTATLEVAARTADGRAFADGPMFRSITSPGFLDLDADTGVLTAKAKGADFIEVTVGDKTTKVPVAVDEFATTSMHDFDTLPAGYTPDWIVAQNHKPNATGLALETTNVHGGKAAWAWSYAMGKGGTTKIALPVKLAIPEGTMALSMAIHGDGQEQWVRGTLRDANGATWVVDFTPTRAGVTWKDEWKVVRASLANPAGMGSKATQPFTQPATLEEIYIVQPQEAAKRDGLLLLDDLQALDLPASLKTP